MKRARQGGDGTCIHCGGPITGRSRRAEKCWGCSAVFIKRSRAAHRMIQAAIRAGRLPPITESSRCVDCGEPATCYDCRSYSRPLVVEPVCHGCRIRRGPADAMEASHAA